MKQKDINHLNFFNIRRLPLPPNHFEYISIPVRYNLENSISKWIEDNLKHRFYLIQTVDLNDSNELNSVLKIGFEDPKELSYFTLACPHLKYN
jgi:hypothetical protein